MKKFLCALALLAASLTASAVPNTNPNLVTNGDFSNGGSNWMLTGNTGYSSFPGYWRDGAVGSDAYLSQVIATIAGQQYEVSFDANVNWGRIYASLDGVKFAEATTTGHYNALVTALSDNATLTFTTRNDPDFNGLDNVEARAVPEPASIALLGLGIAGLCAARRRKNATAKG